MANSRKRKGDRGELEAEGVIYNHTGVRVRRALGAGRKDDIGDIHGMPFTVIQVVNWRDVSAAVRAKPKEAEEQRLRTGENEVERMPFACAMVRLRGTENGEPAFRFVMTPEQFFAIWREAIDYTPTPPPPQPRVYAPPGTERRGI